MSDYFIDFLSFVSFLILCRTPQKFVAHGTQGFFLKLNILMFLSSFLCYYFEDKKRFSEESAL
jgi:hypothetical protein